ncbi:MAG TPA: aldehyde dehydrogenase family protein [Terrimicrobiaceae bacterium]|nr:aldehyde dehydrogenase family protein [Terrimicrobiaceae bacterium]
MTEDLPVWRNRCPGDLAADFPETVADDVPAAVDRAVRAFPGWRKLSLPDRRTLLTRCREGIDAEREELAALIAREVGKPLREARLEVAAVIAKFDLTFADADLHAADHTISDGPHPALVRRRPRGPAAVIAPFNFPIHLGHGAALAYLLGGNTVLFKPSPLASNVGAAYGRIMRSALPDGVFQIVQGGGGTGRNLCLHPAVRSVCFTGSVPVGTELARELAGDYSKSLALELGGMNALIVCDDADPAEAAEAAADGVCLTTGQRCNATSRILVHRAVEAAFTEHFLRALERYQPGDPRLEQTRLGPLVSARSVDRFRRLAEAAGDWILPGSVVPEVDGRAGYYVTPAVERLSGPAPARAGEAFSPVVTLEVCSGVAEMVSRHESGEFGLTASVFTASDATFRGFAETLVVGNLYRNLATTFSPSTLPFGGLKASGNGRPGGRGFIRFAVDEQSVQWKA